MGLGPLVSDYAGRLLAALLFATTSDTLAPSGGKGGGTAPMLSPEIGSADMGWKVGRSRRKALKTVCESALARVFLGRNWPVYLDIVI